jgi:hypothetical protein
MQNVAGLKRLLKVLFITIFSIVLLIYVMLSIQHFSHQEHVRAMNDINWVRQMIAVIQLYKNEFNKWPQKLEDINGLDESINSRSFVSKQGEKLGIKLPHYLYFRPVNDNNDNNTILIMLKPECNESKTGKTIIGYFDGRVMIEKIPEYYSP